MTHHWRASDGLLPTERSNEWLLYDGGVQIGHIQFGRANGRPVFRAVLKRGELVQVIGYSATLEQCCTDFWNWHLRFVKRAG